MRKVRTIPTVVLAGWFVWATGCSTPADAPPPAQPPTPAASATAAAPAPAADSHASMHDLAATPVPDGVQAMLTISPDLPPLPSNALNGARPLAQIKAAYEYAARHPEVLKYMPCFCGCERAGHKGNDDCFVEKRDAQGRVTEWVPHGAICEVCVDVATDARQMQNGGASLGAMRETIEKKYSRAGGNHTPTPMPPGKAGATPQ